MKLPELARTREQIKRDEACRRRMYRDSRGVPTIGWGHNLRNKPIRQEAADLIFEHDFEDAATLVYATLSWVRELDEPRQAVFIGMCFQLGLGGLLAFKRMLEAAEKRDWPLAAAELLDSDLVRDQTPKRASRWARQLKTGMWV